MNKGKVKIFKLPSNPHKLLRDITTKTTLVTPRAFKDIPPLTAEQLELFKFKGK